MSAPRESVLPDAPLTGGDGQAVPLINLLSSLHRLLKVARMYDKNNQALTTSAEAVIAATTEFCATHASGSADLMFANETIFVNGQMLQMPREVYGRVMELGALLERCDIANVNIAKTATVANLVAFVHTLGAALRDPALKGDVAKNVYGGVRARKLRWRAALEGEAEQSPVARVVRTYASAIVVVRRLHAELAAGKAGSEKLPLSIRRLAQRIVAHAEREPPLLVALAAAQDTVTDAATLSVATTLVAVLMARQLTTDGAALTDLALAGLLHDVPRHRMRSGERKTHESPLTEDEQDRLAPTSAALALELEEIGDLTVARTVISFEAHWVGRTSRVGALYGGKRPVSLLARILVVARAFGELMAPGPYGTAIGPAEAIELLESRAVDDTERLYLRLLTGGLGIFPAGTSVELDTGEIAVVLRVPEQPIGFGRPTVRVVYDSAGNAVKAPFDVDLAAPVAERPGRAIVRAIEMDAQQTEAMRAFVGDAKRNGQREAKEAAPRAATAAKSERPAAERGVSSPAPKSAVPASAPKSAVPASAPKSAVPASAPKSALPPSAPKSAVPASAPKSSSPKSTAPSAPRSALPPAPRSVLPVALPPPLSSGSLDARDHAQVPSSPERQRSTVAPPDPLRAADAPRTRPTISPGPLRQPDAPRVSPTISPTALRPTSHERPSSLPDAPVSEAALLSAPLPPSSVDPPTSEAVSSGSRFPDSSGVPRTRYVSSPAIRRASEMSLAAVTAPPLVITAPPDAADTLKTTSPAFQPDEVGPETVPAGTASALIRPPSIAVDYATPHEATRRVDWRIYGDLVAESTSSEKTKPGKRPKPEK